ASDRLRDGTADSLAAPRDSGGPGKLRCQGVAQGPGETLSQRPRARGGSDARASDAAGRLFEARSAGAVLDSAHAQVLPRLLTGRDPRSPPREHVAGLR